MASINFCLLWIFHTNRIKQYTISLIFMNMLPANQLWLIWPMIYWPPFILVSWTTYSQHGSIANGAAASRPASADTLHAPSVPIPVRPKDPPSWSEQTPGWPGWLMDSPWPGRPFTSKFTLQLQIPLSSCNWKWRTPICSVSVPSFQLCPKYHYRLNWGGGTKHIVHSIYHWVVTGIIL